ncbi:transposase [Acidisoma cellulosilytica]|uniref:Transposase n=1 Tax=Acidisoma cellulosilyticum TaxID=2802395 RepID=A0A963Z768_9PROT|nr:hypothetical protein [Acidisoma cellulosilyticum]MCB8884092.1 transposase [Acidisoma cellulosilyticum]
MRLAAELARYGLSIRIIDTASHLPDVAHPHARRTHRMTEPTRLIGYSVGGRPTERILGQLGLPQSDDTVLRSLKETISIRRIKSPRVVGIDDWSCLKGRRYGTVIVDLERRGVVDVLPEHSADATADWLSRRPEIGIVSRDRCGLYAHGRRVVPLRRGRSRTGSTCWTICA